jgi:hypothetical protein
MLSRVPEEYATTYSPVSGKPRTVIQYTILVPHISSRSIAGIDLYTKTLHMNATCRVLHPGTGAGSHSISSGLNTWSGYLSLLSLGSLTWQLAVRAIRSVKVSGVNVHVMVFLPFHTKAQVRPGERDIAGRPKDLR